MLWQLFLPRLATTEDKRIIALLGRYPRGRDAKTDLELIKPAAIRTLGRQGWDAIIDAAVRDAQDQAAKDRLELLR
jgi:hypothetical protein